MKKKFLFLLIVLLFFCPSIQAEMSMRIISRNMRSHEERVDINNEEKKESIESPVAEEAKEEVEVTEVANAVEVAEASEVTEVAEAVAGTTEIIEVPAVEAVKEETEVTEATNTVEVTETSEVAEAADAEEVAEAMAAAKTAETVGATETAKVEDVKEESQVIVTTKAVEVTATPVVTEAVEVEVVEGATEAKEVAVEVTEAAEVIEAEETKEAVEMAEVTKAVEVTESTGPAEVIVPTKTIEAGPVDYEALGLRSVELNPNDYPDEVIALLEPHKNNENNSSVLFYSSLGLAYKSKGRLKAAIDTYMRALKLVPNVPAPSIQYNLGIAYYYNDELHKSLSCFLNSSAQRSDHLGTEKWIKQLADELDIYKVPNTSKLKVVLNRKISVNRKKDDRESRIRMYLTQDGGRIQELSVKDNIYSYGIDSDMKRPVDYIIIDNDGDGNFDNVINTKGKFGVPTWAYNPD